MWWLIIPALIVAFLLVLIIRALNFNPKAQPKVFENEEVFDGDKIVSSLQSLVRCKTVSYCDPALEDDGEFKKLISLLPELYPNVFKVCEFKELPDRALLFYWKGRNEGDPAVLMAHYDVVPVNADMWERDPFGAEIIDGVM